MSEREIARLTARAVAAALVPLVSRVDQRLARVEERVASYVPRRHLTDTTKRQHREVLAWLGGRCPCCGTVNVVDEDGAMIGDGHFDHFASRERNAFTDTWLVCAPCNRMLTRDGHEAHRDAFNAYQRRAERYAEESGRQMALEV